MKTKETDKAKADRRAARDLREAERLMEIKRKRVSEKLLARKSAAEARITVTDVTTLRQVISKPVGMVEVYDPDLKEIPGYAAVRNGEDVVSVVTTSYRLVPHNRIIDPILSFFDNEKINYELGKFTFVDPVRMRVQVNLPDLRITDDSKEGLICSIFVSNSYNASASFSLSAGAYRIVCSNGMMVRESISRVKKIHQADSIEKDAVKSVQDLLTSLKDSQKNLQERVNKLVNDKATGGLLKGFRGAFDATITSHVLREIGLMNYNETNTECWTILEEMDARQTLAQSAWDVFNLLTRYISSPMVYQRYRMLWLSKASKLFAI